MGSETQREAAAARLVAELKRQEAEDESASLYVGTSYRGSGYVVVDGTVDVEALAAAAGGMPVRQHCPAGKNLGVRCTWRTLTTSSTSRATGIGWSALTRQPPSSGACGLTLCCLC